MWSESANPSKPVGYNGHTDTHTHFFQGKEVSHITDTHVFPARRQASKARVRVRFRFRFRVRVRVRV